MSHDHQLAAASRSWCAALPALRLPAIKVRVCIAEVVAAHARLKKSAIQRGSTLCTMLQLRQLELFRSISVITGGVMQQLTYRRGLRSKCVLRRAGL